MKAIKLISDKLKKEGRTKAWLASRIGITRAHLSNILKGRAILTEENLAAINQALQTEFSES